MRAGLLVHALHNLHNAGRRECVVSYFVTRIYVVIRGAEKNVACICMELVRLGRCNALAASTLSKAGRKRLAMFRPRRLPAINLT